MRSSINTFVIPHSFVIPAPVGIQATHHLQGVRINKAASGLHCTISANAELVGIRLESRLRGDDERGDI